MMSIVSLIFVYNTALVAMYGSDSCSFGVLDFCCGSGTCSLAAMSLGYNALAIDNDPEQKYGFSLRLTRSLKAMHHAVTKAISNAELDQYKKPILPDPDDIKYSWGCNEDLMKIISPFSFILLEEKVTLVSLLFVPN